MPTSSGGLLCDCLAPCWRELSRSRLPAFSSAQLAKSYSRFVLARVGVFQWRSVHVLTDGLLYDPKGIDGEISIRA